MRTLYNILFPLFFVLVSPYYFWRMHRRGNWQQGFAQRFGRYDSKFKQAITNRHVLWMHAVSVGEVNVCTQCIRAIESRLPNLKIVVSTTTTTGMGELQRKLPNHIGRIYYPIDFKGFVSHALNTIHPEAIVLVESEIWPNFIWRARGMGIPLFRSFTGVGAQNETDAAKLRELGCRAEAIQVVGSLKFDAARLDERRLLDVPGMFRQLGVPSEARVLAGGSTHPGEET